MNLAHWAAVHRRSILFLVVLLALGGMAAALKLPVSLFPHVDFPRVVVSIEAGDRPADQMSISVTRPVEQAVRSVPGVESLRSTTSRGSAEISINFNWGDDMVGALLQIDAAINQALSSMPPGTSFNVRRMDPTVFPIAAYSLTSDKMSQVELRDLAEFQLSPLLSSVSGIANVTVMGGDKAEYRIEIDLQKLAAYNLTFDDVVNAVSANNMLQAVGRLEDHYKLYLLLSDTRIHSIETIAASVIRSGTDGLVRLEDIAKIYPTTVPQWLKVNADGHDAVLLQIYQQPAGNAVQITHDIQQQLESFSTKLPEGVKIANWYDQSQLVTAAAGSVRDAIAIGVILAALVLFIFLRSLKITLIAIFIVPTVLASTVLLLWVLDMSFNIMTLGGMAAAVGLIVDDAIVMLEHIIRRIRENTNIANRTLAIREAAIEFTKPLVGSSSATIIIFLPLAFLSGVTGAFFKALSMTMACSLFVSFLMAWLAVPILAEHLVSEKDAQEESQSSMFAKIQAGYRDLMNDLLNKPWHIVWGIVPLIVLGAISYQQVGSGFIPKMDEGGFVLDYTSESGTSLTETDRLLQQIEAILVANPSVETYSRRTGMQLGGGLTEANEGDFFIRLKPMPRPPIEHVMDEIRETIELEVPGLEVEMVLLMEDIIGDLTAVPQPIEIKLYSDNHQKLLNIAPDIAELIKTIDGVVDVKDGIVLAGNAINIVVDRDKAGLEGISPDQVTQQLAAWFEGVVATEVQAGIKIIPARVWVPASIRNKSSALDKVWLRAADGRRIPLKRIANVEVQSGQPQIVRDNLKSMVAVTGRISGRDLGSTITEINRTLSASGTLPKDIYYELGGLYKQQQIAFQGLLAVFIAAFALVFLLLLFMYEEFIAAIAIMVSPLLAIAAVFIGLWITDTELNITAMMGMTMIVGIVTEVSIFYFSEYHALIRNNVPQKLALIEAGGNRLRPITMTTLAAILALLPLAVTLDLGSAMQQPLAIAIISGLIVQIPLVTLVMPLLYFSLTKKFNHISN